METVDEAFTKALPKLELHAHLTGSISVECLHEIWRRKHGSSKTARLEDPLEACRPIGSHHNILSFFPLFDKYIYNLCNDRESIAFATKEVLKAFESDGVRYLELRTTPRAAPDTGLTKDAYIATVLDAIQEHGSASMSTYLILSIDRRNTLEQAFEVVELATTFHTRGVVGIDLCGNPLEGDVKTFRDAFWLAKNRGFKITVHFAEVPQSSTTLELQTLLSYRPDRIGHVIHVPAVIREQIQSRKLGLELCLSCNVLAELTSDGYANHHLGKWLSTECPLALCTDDVGVFGSPVSNEYLLAAEHFKLSRKDLVQVCRRGVPSIFGGDAEQDRLLNLIAHFEESVITSRESDVRK